MLHEEEAVAQCEGYRQAEMQSTQSGHSAQAVTTVYRLTKSVLTWISQITSETLRHLSLGIWLLDPRTSLGTGDTKKKP